MWVQLLYDICIMLTLDTQCRVFQKFLWGAIGSAAGEVPLQIKSATQ